LIKLKYRPEIDSLRAFAVLAVVIYHAKFNFFGNILLPGGYLGVDVFFIISGYLITSLILKELINTDSFSFKSFYIKRVRRILPVLLLVIFVSIPFSWIYLFPSDLVSFSKSILYSLGFSSNFYFHFSGLDYGSPEGLQKPFLHTWSLSIEEQFYIIFPICLFLIFKYSRKNVFLFFIICFVVSLILANWGSKNYISANFYLLYSRIWELILGSCVAYYEIKIGHREQNKVLNQILTLIGFILIFGSFFIFDNETFHPSLWTLIPALGVVLILWFYSSGNLILRFLTNRIFVWIGLISYSLYLWHYPIFSFANYTGIFFDKNFEKIILIIFTFTISLTSYFLVEQPFRKSLSFKKLISLIIIITTIIVIYCIITIKMDGFSKRLKVKNIQNKHTFLYLEKDGKPCFNRICNFDLKKKKIILLGDSHLASLAYDLQNKTKNDYSFLSITSQGYFHLRNVDQINKHSKKVNQNYIKRRNEIDKILKQSKDNIIILGGVTSLYFFNKRIEKRSLHWDYLFVSKNSKKYDPEVVKNSFLDLILSLAKENKVILLYPIPEMGVNLQTKKFENMVRVFNYSFSDYLKQNKEVINFFNNINFPNVYKVYSFKAFCKEDPSALCNTHDNDNFYFYDGYHPSIRGAELINDLILEKITNLYK
jgi:peptidoglycan/LPS O-acetylase OafA/YrhL/lysophospholipase L1-like esterase